MKELLRTTNPMTILHAQTLLSGIGIASFEMDVNMNTLYGEIFPRRLLVLDDEYDEALDFLRDQVNDAIFTK